MKTLQEIKLILSNHKSRLFTKYPIRSLAIFGSVVRNEQNEKSDLDILVDLDGKIGIRFIDLADEIEELTGLKVDLVSRKGIKDKYLNSISSDLIYV